MRKKIGEKSVIDPNRPDWKLHMAIALVLEAITLALKLAIPAMAASDTKVTMATDFKTQ